MWLNTKQGLIHVKDKTRMNYRTSISEEFLRTCRTIAEENDAYVNYVIENGLRNMRQDPPTTFKKTKQARVQFQTTYNKELLSWVKHMAGVHQVNINTIIEESVHYIKTNTIKTKQFPYRIERRSKSLDA